jgi:hypothetical protein
MSESNLKARVKSKYKDVFIQDIESPTTGTGIPDSYLLYNSIPAWAESKYAKRWPVRGGILRIQHYTLAQRLWLKNHYEKGGLSLLILGVGREILIFKNEDAIMVGLVDKQWLLDRAYHSLYQVLQ